MKNFMKENWYKMIIGCSFFMLSVSALIYSTGTANATESYPLKQESDGYRFIVKNNTIYYLRANFYDGTSNLHWKKVY